MKIVVGTDGSPGGTNAVRWAAGTAERGGHSLHVVVAYHWQTPGRWYGSVEELTDAADERAGGIATEATTVARASAPHVDVACSMRLGDPAPTLLDAAGDAGMLVVGNRGGGGFRGLLLGSAGMQVATHAPCPVAVVREHFENVFGPVVVGVDGSHEADLALGLAFAQAAERHCRLRVITAEALPYPAAPMGIPPIIYDAEEAREQISAHLVQQLAGWSGKYPDVTVDDEVISGSPGRVLVDQSRHAQLVVVGTRGHGGFSGLLLGSVGLHLLHHAECPVLIARGR